MLTTHGIGLLTIVLVVIAWVAVQNAWRRVFTKGRDPDALAGRIGCHGAGCSHSCEEDMR